MYIYKIKKIGAHRRKVVSVMLLILISSLLVYTYITSTLAFNVPGYFPLEVSTLRLYGENKMEKNTFERGELVICEINITKPLTYFVAMGKNNSVQPLNVTDYYYIITVINDNNIPIYFGIIPQTIELGNIQTIPFSFQLTENLDLGSYYIIVMTWGIEGLPLSEVVMEADFFVS